MEVVTRYKFLTLLILFHCLYYSNCCTLLEGSMYASVYCKRKLKHYWNGLMHFLAKCGVTGWMDG